jgi:hypothetical protein
LTEFTKEFRVCAWLYVVIDGPRGFGNMKKFLTSLFCGALISLAPLASQADDAAAQAAVQQGLADDIGMEGIITMLMADPHNMSLGDATVFAMNAGGDSTSMAFMSAGLDMACEDSNARIAIVSQQLVQIFGADSDQALEARRALDNCQPSIYVDDYSTGGRGDVSPSV